MCSLYDRVTFDICMKIKLILQTMNIILHYITYNLNTMRIHFVQ